MTFAYLCSIHQTPLDLVFDLIIQLKQFLADLTHDRLQYDRPLLFLFVFPRFFQTFNILDFSVDFLWWTPLFHLTLSLKMRMTFLLHQASSQQRLAHLRAGKLSADVAP